MRFMCIVYNLICKIELFTLSSLNLTSFPCVKNQSFTNYFALFFIQYKIRMAIVTGTKMEIVIGSMAAPEVATDALARYEVAPAKTPAPVPAAAVVEAAKPAAPAL